MGYSTAQAELAIRTIGKNDAAAAVAYLKRRPNPPSPSSLPLLHRVPAPLAPCHGPLPLLCIGECIGAQTMRCLYILLC